MVHIAALAGVTPRTGARVDTDVVGNVAVVGSDRVERR